MASHLETVSGGVSKLSSELFKGQRFTSQASNSLTAGTSSGARSKSFESLSSTSQAAIISQETSGSFERWVEQLKAPKSHRAKTTASTHLRHLSQSLCLILFCFFSCLFFRLVLGFCFICHLLFQVRRNMCIRHPPVLDVGYSHRAVGYESLSAKYPDIGINISDIHHWWMSDTHISAKSKKEQPILQPLAT
jgi:hypothetical protein